MRLYITTQVHYKSEILASIENLEQVLQTLENLNFGPNVELSFGFKTELNLKELNNEFLFRNFIKVALNEIYIFIKRKQIFSFDIENIFRL